MTAENTPATTVISIATAADVDAGDFAATMQSFGTDAKLKRAAQFIQRSGVDGTPTLIVDGKYRVTGGNTYAEMLQITDQLIQKERAAGASASS